MDDESVDNLFVFHGSLEIPVTKRASVGVRYDREEEDLGEDEDEIAQTSGVGCCSLLSTLLPYDTVVQYCTVPYDAVL